MTPADVSFTIIDGGKFKIVVVYSKTKNWGYKRTENTLIFMNKIDIQMVWNKRPSRYLPG